VIEIELKGVLADEEALARRVEQVGGRALARGRMTDLRFDGPTGGLSGKGEMLRLRREASGGLTLAWKGPSSEKDGYKVREELAVGVSDEVAALAILERLGYRQVHRIDRDVVEMELLGCSLRVERYPDMDVLLEVEGEVHAIEAVFAPLGLERQAFTGEPLAAFVQRFEARTGRRARLAF
jgi:predicted adenylyl cyclase CyaB